MFIAAFAKIWNNQAMFTCAALAEPLQNQLLAAIRAEVPAALSIYAFGSQVSGGANNQSELSMAVLVAGYAEPISLRRLQKLLSDIAAMSVDLIDFRAASTVRQHHILTTGIRLWTLDIQAELYELFVLREKFYLDESAAAASRAFYA